MNGTTPNRSAMKASRRRGYSLVELTIVASSVLALSTMALPKLLSITKSLHSSTDARALSAELSVAKMQAAASFTRIRLYVDTSAKTYHTDVWNKTSSTWVMQGGVDKLSPDVTVGYGNLTSPPASTQSSLAQAPACTDNSGNAIANTVCLVVNSRSNPVDSTGSPTGNDALYITDGATVFGVTISTMGTIQTWRSPVGTAVWSKL
jgi:Tfp pilus assembly protein FimT